MRDSTLKHPHCSLFPSHLTDGCTLWSSPTDVHLNQVRKLQTWAIRTITFSKYNDHTSQHFRNLKVLKINDILRLQQLLFVQNFDKNRLPTGLNWLFQRTENVHNRLTRFSSARGLHIQKFNTSTYDRLSSLRHTGTKGLNSLKNDAVLNNATNKNTLSAYFQTRPLCLTKQLGITNIVLCY